MLTFQQVEADSNWWERQEQLPDYLIYHTKEWISFVQEAQNATPIFAQIRDGSSLVGHFVGLVISRFGVRILGSPFPGWATMYMGFNLEPEVPRWMALQGLERFAFRDLGCLHVEITDRLFTDEDGKRNGFTGRFFSSYETDLANSEEQLFDRMAPSCRRCVRKASKNGIVIEQADGDDSFVDDYYEQLKDVFLKQGLVPSYGRDFVKLLIRHLYPTGRLLLLRARSQHGKCIATGIYPGTKRLAQFWGNASFRSSQHLRPNQALNWYAIDYWRIQGAKCSDWGGGGEYKLKYGCRKIVVHRFCKSRIPFLLVIRDQAMKTFRGQQRLMGWLSKRVNQSPEDKVNVD